MRTIRRPVILLGCIGFIALYILQYGVALAVTPLILVMGVLVGLVVAKWLPWRWYGRQFAAGVRAGVVACGLSAAGVLLSLVGTGPHNVAALAARSHLLGIDLGHFVTALGSAGWFMPYLLLTAFFALGGVLLAGVVTQIVGWSKSVRTVRVIRQAHNSASSLHRSQTWAPASNSVPSVGAYWNSALPSAGPASLPGLLATGAMGSIGHTSGGYASVAARSGSRARHAQDAQLESRAGYLPPLPSLDFDAPAPMAPLPVTPDPIPARRSNSGAQPVQFAMTDDLRHALDRWDSDPEIRRPGGWIPESEGESVAPKKSAATKGSTASKARTPTKRQPKHSAYLNSDTPAVPRRSRKKQQTRDWLC